MGKETPCTHEGQHTIHVTVACTPYTMFGDGVAGLEVAQAAGASGAISCNSQ